MGLKLTQRETGSKTIKEQNSIPTAFLELLDPSIPEVPGRFRYAPTKFPYLLRLFLNCVIFIFRKIYSDVAIMPAVITLDAVIPSTSNTKLHQEISKEPEGKTGVAG